MYAYFVLMLRFYIYIAQSVPRFKVRDLLVVSEKI